MDGQNSGTVQLLFKPGREMESISELVGAWGPWQLNIFFLDLSIQMISTMNALSPAFMAPKINYWCVDDRISNNSISNSKQCLVTVDNGTVPCRNWKYDTSFFQSTLVSEYDIVCDKAWLSSFSASLYMIGYFFSSLLSGHLSDKFGRLKVLWAAVIVELLSGLSCAMTVSITHFLVSRFFLAVAGYAKFLTGFTLLMESAGSEYRTTFGVLARGGRSLGHIILPIVAYFYRDFRQLQLAITLPGLLWIVWLFKVQESPRWLIVNNKLEEAEAVIRIAATANKKSLVDLKQKLLDIKKQMDESKNCANTSRKHNFFDLWKTPRLRTNTSVMSFNWFATVFIYYALSFNVQSLGGNLFQNFIISGVVELPSLALSIFALKRIGRKTVLIYAQIGTFMAFLFAAPTYLVSFSNATQVRVILSMFGKFCATCTFAVNYIFSSEIYPTCIRQIGVGTNSAAGRLGSMMSPFIKELNYVIHPAASFGIYSGLAAITASLVGLLPETKGKDIPDTIEQVESGDLWAKKSKLKERSQVDQNENLEKY